MSPTPNTTFFRDAARCGHFWQTIARARKSAMAACFVWRSSGATPGEAGDKDSALACDGAAIVDSNKGNAGRGSAGERVGTATVELDSRTHGETSAATGSWDSGMNLTPCAFRTSKCRIVASSNRW